jgi:hypothetical protein
MVDHGVDPMVDPMVEVIYTLTMGLKMPIYTSILGIFQLDWSNIG